MRIFAGNANRVLAERIVSSLGVELGDVTLRHFSDGEIYCKFNENIRGEDVFIVQGTQPPAEHLMELLIMIDAAKRASARRVTAVIPYYGYARSDRKSEPRVSISSKLCANLIVTAGADRVLTMDLHSPQIQGFFDIPFDHLYGSPAFMDFILDMQIEGLVVVAPDVGGVKLAGSYAKKLNAALAILDKRRPKPNEAAIHNVIGDVAGHNILIIDDMVDTAGTLVKGTEVLKQQGAKRIIAACIHPILSGKARDVINDSPIEMLAVSDTVPIPNDRMSDKLVVVSVAHLFAEAIERINEEKSISSLFDWKIVSA
jgi:ribose-phosphate pyrophosphokinase